MSRQIVSRTLAMLLATVSVSARAEPGVVAPPQQSSPEQLVDALHSAFGRHDARAVHAKGIILEGTFNPDPKAAALTKAAHLQKVSSAVVLRFSDFTGIPNIPDNDPNANPRGFAIRFRLPDGRTTDIVGHSFNGFPTATSDEFRELLLAIAESGPNAAKPTKLDAFLASHPIAKTFLTTQKMPESYATIAYFGVSSFKFTDRSGASRFVRYQFIPVGGQGFITSAQATAKGPNYLIDEIRARVAFEPFAFDMYAQIAEKGDQIENPSIAWPDSRKRVPLGRIVINKVASNTDAESKALAFDPTRLPVGIEPADPMLTFRAKAYPISVKERRGGTAAIRPPHRGLAKASP